MRSESALGRSVSGTSDVSRRGPGNLAAGDRGPERLVFARPEALGGRDAGAERDVRVAGDRERALELRLAVVAGVIAALGVEVPHHVVVCVDQPGQQRERGEVVHARAGRDGRVRRDGGDTRAAHHDDCVGDGAAGAVEHAGSANDGHWLLRVQRGARESDQQCGGEEPSEEHTRSGWETTSIWHRGAHVVIPSSCHSERRPKAGGEESQSSRPRGFPLPG